MLVESCRRYLAMSRSLASLRGREYQLTSQEGMDREEIGGKQESTFSDESEIEVHNIILVNKINKINKMNKNLI